MINEQHPCPACGKEMGWQDCTQCWGNGTIRTAGQPNLICNQCRGDGGAYFCIETTCKDRLQVATAKQAPLGLASVDPAAIRRRASTVYNDVSTAAYSIVKSADLKWMHLTISVLADEVDRLRFYGGAAVGVHPCPICGRAFSTASGLGLHQSHAKHYERDAT